MENSPLDTLPAELRNNIYHAVLKHDAPIEMCQDSDSSQAIHLV